jgi:hypothetical protein
VRVIHLAAVRNISERETERENAWKCGRGWEVVEMGFGRKNSSAEAR